MTPPIPHPAPTDPYLERWTDGGCTGFPNGIGAWDWRACCIEHDLTGTDGQLLDCITAVVPDWAAGLVGIAVTIMLFYNPIYDWLHARGWVK